jgi:hypothetical protein
LRHFRPLKYRYQTEYLSVSAKETWQEFYDSRLGVKETPQILGNRHVAIPFQEPWKMQKDSNSKILYIEITGKNLGIEV